MKYIRTEDGRIFEKEYFSYESILQAHFYHGRFVDCKEPIKEADTIEELIDLYVIVTEDGRHITMSVDKAVADLEDDYLRKYYFIKGDYAVYGETWANDELHKAARMNSEGRLELL